LLGIPQDKASLHPTEGQPAILRKVVPVSDGMMRADCPFDHPGQGTLYLYPGARWPMFHCFGCGTHGTFTASASGSYALTVRW
jgi:hypothetical protein